MLHSSWFQQKSACLVMIDCLNNGVEGSCFSSIGRQLGRGGVDLVVFF
jgi:hypothetical protein